jgi:hypothetical protein
MNKCMLALISLLLLPLAAGAQEHCPCVPVSHLWIVEPCETWNCATSATVLAAGDKYVFALPTNSDDFKWVVLRRVPSGTAVQFGGPFTIETFDTSINAMSRLGAIDPQLAPMIVSGADGKFLVVARSLPEVRKRAVAH